MREKIWTADLTNTMQRAVAQGHFVEENEDNAVKHGNERVEKDGSAAIPKGTADSNVKGNENENRDGEEERNQQIVSHTPSSTFPHWITDWALTLRG